MWSTLSQRFGHTATNMLESMPNWHALEAVLRDCPPVDQTHCLGDVVGYGGDPKRCLDEVTKQGWPTLVGNHDRACTDPEILEWFQRGCRLSRSLDNRCHWR